MWKPDYNITRFIMDCAKYNGYNSIKYNSIRNPTGTDIVLFECKREMFVSYSKPQIVIHNRESEENLFQKIFGNMNSSDLYQ